MQVLLPTIRLASTSYVCLGYGILEWEVLVPYAELPRYLRPATSKVGR